MIVMLESENEELRKNLSLASSKQNERRDQMVTKKFEQLLETQGLLTVRLHCNTLSLHYVQLIIPEGLMKRSRNLKKLIKKLKKCRSRFLSRERIWEGMIIIVKL